jgi:hypothetical protein
MCATYPKAGEIIRGLVDEGLLQRDYEDKRWRKHDRQLLREMRIN